MSLETIVATYGYWALFLGTFLEGETVLIMAGLLANQGYLRLEYVITVACLGGLLGDEFFFFLGRYKGKQILCRFPSWQGRVSRVHQLLEKYRNMLIVVVRFLYGLRIALPMFMGMSMVPARVFMLFNLVGAVVWAVGISLAGFFFGAAFEAVFGHLKHYLGWILPGMAVMGGLALLLFEKKEKKAASRVDLAGRTTCKK